MSKTQVKNAIKDAIKDEAQEAIQETVEEPKKAPAKKPGRKKKTATEQPKTATVQPAPPQQKAILGRVCKFRDYETEKYYYTPSCFTAKQLVGNNYDLVWVWLKDNIVERELSKEEILKYCL